MPPEPAPFDPDRQDEPFLLLVAPSEKSPSYDNQMRLLDEERDAMEARGLTLVQLFLDGEAYVAERRMAPEAAARLRERHGGSDDTFRVLLCGPGGVVLAGYDSPVRPTALFRTLDEEQGMPTEAREP